MGDDRRTGSTFTLGQYMSYITFTIASNTIRTSTQLQLQLDSND